MEGSGAAAGYNALPVLAGRGWDLCAAQRKQGTHDGGWDATRELILGFEITDGVQRGGFRLRDGTDLQ